MSFLIFLIILFSEGFFFLKLFSLVLVFLRFFFFFCGNFFLLFFFFELSVFPIVIIILGYGNQIEKISSSYYLFFYSSFCSMPFLLVLFNIDYFFFFLYMEVFFCWELVFFVCIFFIIKFPVYFLHF
jgi:hypothetical protein